MGTQNNLYIFTQKIFVMKLYIELKAIDFCLLRTTNYT